MESPRKRLLILGLPPGGRLAAVEELFYSRCSQRIVCIDMREGFALVDLESSGDIPHCIGRHTLMGQVVIVIAPTEDVENEIHVTGRVPQHLARQVAMIQTPGTQAAVAAGMHPSRAIQPGALQAQHAALAARARFNNHQRGHSDSQIGTKRTHTDMFDTTWSDDTESIVAARFPPRATASIQGLDLEGMKAQVRGRHPSSGAMLVTTAAPTAPDGPAWRGSMGGLVGDHVQGMPIGYRSATGFESEHRHHFMGAAMRDPIHARAHSDNAVLQGYVPSPLALSHVLSEGHQPGDASLVCGPAAGVRRTRVGLQYKCGKCGQPKKGHVCAQGGDGDSEINEEAPGAEEAPAEKAAAAADSRTMKASNASTTSQGKKRSSGASSANSAAPPEAVATRLPIPGAVQAVPITTCSLRPPQPGIPLPVDHAPIMHQHRADARYMERQQQQLTARQQFAMRAAERRALAADVRGVDADEERRRYVQQMTMARFQELSLRRTGVLPEHEVEGAIADVPGLEDYHDHVPQHVSDHALWLDRAPPGSLPMPQVPGYLPTYGGGCGAEYAAATGGSYHNQPLHAEIPLDEVVETLDMYDMEGMLTDMINRD